MPRRKMEIPELYKFTSYGSTLKGYLVSARPQVIGGQHAMRYVIRTDNGQKVINGTAVLDECLAQVTIGEMVEITYTGDRPTESGMSVRVFDVFTGEDEVKNGKK